MSDALRVLLVEDSPTDAKLVVQAAPATGRPRRVRAGRDGRGDARGPRGAAPGTSSSRDWSMPRFSAPAALGVLKRRGSTCRSSSSPGTIGEEAAVEAMRAGAHDYVLKDKLGRLAPAVERELRECQGARGAREASRSARERGALSTARRVGDHRDLDRRRARQHPRRERRVPADGRATRARTSPRPPAAGPT